MVSWVFCAYDTAVVDAIKHTKASLLMHLAFVCSVCGCRGDTCLLHQILKIFHPRLKAFDKCLELLIIEEFAECAAGTVSKLDNGF